METPPRKTRAGKSKSSKGLLKSPETPKNSKATKSGGGKRKGTARPMWRHAVAQCLRSLDGKFTLTGVAAAMQAEATKDEDNAGECVESEGEEQAATPAKKKKPEKKRRVYDLKNMLEGESCSARCIALGQHVRGGVRVPGPGQPCSSGRGQRACTQVRACACLVGRQRALAEV